MNYWGITDEGAWLGAPSGLLRRDGSRKPSYDALPASSRGSGGWRRRPRPDGRLGPARLRGFAGEYRVTAGSAESTVTIGRDAPTAVRLTAE